MTWFQIRAEMLETRKIVSTLNCIVKRRMCAQHKLPSSQWKIQTSKEECVPNTSCHQASGKYRRQRKNVCPTQAAIKPVENTDVKGRTCAQHKLSSSHVENPDESFNTSGWDSAQSSMVPRAQAVDNQTDWWFRWILTIEQMAQEWEWAKS